MRVALIEMDTVWEDEAANRDRITSALPAADAAEVALLPELAFSGFTMSARPDPDAEPFLASLARERSLHIVAGCCGEGPRNLAVAAAPDGTILARYAKNRLFPPAGEPRHYKRGEEVPLFDLLGAKTCMLICYDLRFPELFRDATRRGAELFLVLANWPRRRVTHWRTLLAARAIENQAFVLGVNRVGRDPNEEYESSSLAIDPLGEELLRGPGIVEIEIERARRWRREFPVLDGI